MTQLRIFSCVLAEPHAPLVGLEVVSEGSTASIEEFVTLVLGWAEMVSGVIEATHSAVYNLSASNFINKSRKIKNKNYLTPEASQSYLPCFSFLPIDRAINKTVKTIKNNEEVLSNLLKKLILTKWNIETAYLQFLLMNWSVKV